VTLLTRSLGKHNRSKIRQNILETGIEGWSLLKTHRPILAICHRIFISSGQLFHRAGKQKDCTHCLLKLMI